MDNFMYRHWKYKIVIIQEILTQLPRWDQYGVKIPTARLVRHSQMASFNRSTDIRIWRRDVEIFQRMGDM